MSHNDERQLTTALCDDGVTVPLAATLTAPDPMALSTTTTAYDPMDRTPRSSRDSAPAKNPFETDIEAVEMDAPSPNPCRKAKCAPRRSDRQVWPGKDHWIQVAKAAKAKRSCKCMASMSRRNRILTKIAIVLLVIGGGLAIGFGISRTKAGRG